MCALKLWNLFILFFILNGPFLYAKERFFSIHIKARKTASLRETIYASTRIPSKVINNPNFMSNVLRYNPKLRNRDIIQKGEKIYIEMPLKDALAYSKRSRKYLPKIAKEVKDKKLDNPEKRYRYSVSYSLSRKEISDTSADISIDSQQNALYTIGASFNYRFNDTYSFFTTGYFSKMNTAVSPATEGQEIDVPLEMAMKAYIQRPMWSLPFTIYTGFDIERLSTFKLTNDNQVARLQHSFAFLTLGVAKPFKLFGRTLLAKASFARSVWNKLDLESESTQTFETFSGNKIAMLLIVPILKRVGIHFYYDRHILEAESKLDMQRFGSGVHFRF